MKTEDIEAEAVRMIQLVTGLGLEDATAEFRCMNPERREGWMRLAQERLREKIVGAVFTPLKRETPEQGANAVDSLVTAWGHRAAVLKRAGESDQAGIYLVCATQLQEALSREKLRAKSGS